MKYWKQTILPILLMFSAVLFDGFLTSYFTASLNTEMGLIVPRTIILMIILLTFHYSQPFMLGSAAFIGFIMDTYYLGFLGVYMASFLLVVTIVLAIKQIIQVNPFSYTLVSILGLTASELVVYSIMRILGVTTYSLQMFIVSRLSTTLLFNGFLMLIFSYFIHRLIVSTLEELEGR